MSFSNFGVYASIQSASRWRDIPHPPGFSRMNSSSKRSKAVAALSPRTVAHDQLKDKRAWDLAFSPAKSLAIQFFMLYMSGSGVQIFSIPGIIFFLLSSPLKNIAGMSEAFAPFAPSVSESSRSFSILTSQKLAYFACNLLTICVGLWKCYSIGLLPTGTGDWLAFETRGLALELTLL